MNEIELYNQYLALENRIRDLKIYVQIWSNDKERQDFEAELETALVELENLSAQLTEIEDKRHSTEVRSRMVDQLAIYIREMNGKPRQFLLDTGNDLNIPNELYAMLVRDLNYILLEGYRGGHVPYFKLTTSEDFGVELGQYYDFLINERRILLQLDEVNFIVLKEYVEELIERLRDQFLN